MRPLLCLLGLAALSAADIPTLIGADRLGPWRAAVAEADAGRDPLVVVALGDSNTEIPRWTSRLREILQGCYGARGIGYHTFGPRVQIPEAPRIERSGTWLDLDTSPKPPAKPWFAVDGLWAESSDAAAAIAVTFDQREWGKAADPLMRAYDGTQRVRIHYATGPDRGSFSVEADGAPRLRIDARSAKPGYGVSEAFIARTFRVHGLAGPCTLLGFDAERCTLRGGRPVLDGGAIVHALGNGWGMAREAAETEAEAWRGFSAAVKPDLFVVLFGTNDQHNDGVVRNYTAALDTLLAHLRAAAPQAAIVVVSCPEAGQTKEGLAKEFRAAAAAAADRGGAAFWDLGGVVGERSARWLREGLYGDGLHYSEVGGALIARLLLRQLGFDATDPAHLRTCLGALPAPVQPQVTLARLAAVPALDGVAAALAAAEPQVVWNGDQRAAEVRLAVAGGSLLLHARVFDAACAGEPATWTDGGSLELYLADPRVLSDNRFAPGPLVRQLVIHPRAVDKGSQATLHVYQKPEEPATLPLRTAPLVPMGWEAVAIIPGANVGLGDLATPFLLELSVSAAPRAGAARVFNRCYAQAADRGAFRDASGSALVESK